MIVAYDLRYACDHFAGIGTHAYALLRSLLELPGEERYLVLWNPRLVDSRHDLAAIARHPRVRWLEEPLDPIHPLDLVRLGTWLRSHRPDVYFSAFYLVPFAASCPTVVMVHDVWPLRLPQGLGLIGHLLYRVSLFRAARADRVITSSEFSRAEFVALARAPAARVRAVLQGVRPPAEGAPEARPSGAPDGRFALVVGDNRPRKNLGLLARTWALLGEGAPLALVGAGPADARYPTLAALAALEGARRVVGLGWVSEAELAWLYTHAEVLLFPSLYEGFGAPMVEAFARDLPVLASDIPAFREVADGAASLLDPTDAAAWADAIRWLACSREAREALRSAGRRRAAALPYRHTAERTLAVLREAVAARDKSQR